VIRRRAASDPGNRQARADLIDAMSKATRAALLSNHPQEVITLADELLKLDSGQLTVGINRAHALLLTGRIADAKSIYEEGRRTRHPNDPQLTWIEYVKEDFAMLRRLGLADANLEQVARELGI
jgi:predicted Zn-dependent protease